MPVVVVESPAKAKTINKYLGSDYTVLASYGHVRDLPPRTARSIPTRVRHDVGGRLRQQETRQGDCRRAEGRPDLILATDPDREGRRSAGTSRRRWKSARRSRRTARSPRDLQRDHQGRGDRRRWRPARGRHGTGRGLSRPPRAGLPRRLHAVAGAVAQAAGGEIGGPGAVRRAAGSSSTARWRSRPSARGNTGRYARSSRPRAARPSRRVSSPWAARSWTDTISPPRPRRARRQGRVVPRAVGHGGGGEARHPQPVAALHDLDPAAGGQRASSASARNRP
jgi:hypothetical protein